MNWTRLPLVLLAVVAFSASGVHAIASPTQANVNCDVFAGPLDDSCVMGPPGQVRATQASQFEEFEVLVEWDPPILNSGMVAYYTVHDSPPTEWPEPQVREVCPTTTQTNCVVTGLGPGEHRFWVQAVSAKGYPQSSGPSTPISLPFKAKKRTKYAEFVELATDNLNMLRDSEDENNLELGYQLYISAAGMKLQSNNGRAVCRYLKRSKKGGISGREIRNATDVIWENLRTDVDFMTGQGISLDNIRGVMRMNEASLASAINVYCPRYTSLYFDRLSPALVSKYERYVG